MVALGLAVWKWHIVRDGHLLFSALKIALREPRAYRIGILAGLTYMTVFMGLGGKGGRIHVLLGRLVVNATNQEILTGVFLGLLVSISTALLVYRLQVVEPTKPGKKEGGIKILATLLAVLAAFCP